MKRKTITAAALAATLAIGAAAPAWAYFTDSTQATGGLRVGKPGTTVQEYYAESQKHLVVTNDADATAAVAVRARVFANDGLTGTIGGTGWSGPAADGWYYYGASASDLTPLDPGASTEELLVQVTTPTIEGQPDDSRIGENYNVIVLYEATPMLYEDDNTPYADWTSGASKLNQKGGE